MGTSASFARKISACLVAALLSLALIPASALAEDGTWVDDSSVTLSGAAEGGGVEGSNEKPLTLASGLVGAPSNFINSDVALDGEPVVGSFTVDGLTYAVIDESHVELVGVSEAAADAGTLMLPESVAYADSEYTLASISPYAFYLSGVVSVTLPASVSDVDDRAFRSSDVASVTVAEGNQDYSSFDGALYSADKTRLLLIPEGRVGAVLLPRETEVADPGKFSHCSLVDAISVEDGAAFASENGLLYTSDLTTLLRVPAGATDITIREGCTTIAAGALEACAKLVTINAPATVTSISPDVFHAIPTVSLPAASVILGESGEAAGAEGPNEGQASEAGAQLTAMVALSTSDDDLPEISPLNITVFLPHDENLSLWGSLGFKALATNKTTESSTDLQQATAYAAGGPLYIKYNGAVNVTRGTTSSNRFQTKWKSLTCTSSGTYLGNMLTVSSGGSGANLFDGTYYYGLVLNGTIQYIASSSVYGSPIYEGITYEMNGADYVTLTAQRPQLGRMIKWDANGGTCNTASTVGPANSVVRSPTPTKTGYRCLGWFTSPSGGSKFVDAGTSFTLNTPAGIPPTYYAQWERTEYHVSFDTSSEPSDMDHPGEAMQPIVIVGDQVASGDKIEIGDPSRPGYLFQGWVIRDAEGRAVHQDVVFKEWPLGSSDGRWVIDASRLPDCYDLLKDDEGKIVLVARWTSIISVDVPSAATFYYDLTADQSAEAHEAALAGTTSFSSASASDLRICGLVSESAGGEELFEEGYGAAVLSAYPAMDDEPVTEEEAQRPAGAKPDVAVDFALDDMVLEEAFARVDADAYRIPSGGRLTLTYRLNLDEGMRLDYDKILSIPEGADITLAILTYCFAVC